MRNIDLKSLAIGLLLGICIMLGRGQAAVSGAGAGATGRYQISSCVDPGNNAPIIFVLDQQNNKIYSCTPSAGWGARQELLTISEH